MNTRKTAMITIAGRPNVGKSTLINALVGEKVAIVTPKPQTTRNRICAVLERGGTQFVLIDTPGLHKPQSRLGEYMVKIARDSVADVDAVLLMVEPIAQIGPPERILIERIQALKVPAILAINKIDTVKKEQLLEVIDVYSKANDFTEIVPISAKKGEGIEGLLGLLQQYAAVGPPLFPEGMVTDQPEKQMVAEIVREKLLICLEREVPHGTAVEVNHFTDREDGLIEVGVTIYCEKDSHKGIIIGKQGEMLKKISSMARRDMEHFMGAKVYLETWVKVKENWRQNQTMVRNFGYRES